MAEYSRRPIVLVGKTGPGSVVLLGFHLWVCHGSNLEGFICFLFLALLPIKYEVSQYISFFFFHFKWNVQQIILPCIYFNRVFSPSVFSTQWQMNTFSFAQLNPGFHKKYNSNTIFTVNSWTVGAILVCFKVRVKKYICIPK